VKAALDHLVVAARTLDEGAAWCEATLGVVPGPGGRHALMGTHNRLFKVASEAFPDAYFEIIAVDPDAPPPGRARWFGLDRTDLTAGPRLVSFVARVENLDAALVDLRAAGLDAGCAWAASRETPSGPLRWRIALRDDGAPLCHGALPTLIEWGDRHPAASMPDSGVVLRSLVLHGVPVAAAAALDLVRVRLDRDNAVMPALEAHLDTPRGPLTLSSR
jgi:hypothetical protein